MIRFVSRTAQEGLLAQHRPPGSRRHPRRLSLRAIRRATAHPGRTRSNRQRRACGPQRNGSAERLDRDRARRRDRVRARLWRRTHRSEDAGDSFDALRHRVCQQAVHRDRDPAARRGGQAVAARQGREVVPAAHARERHQRAATAVDDVGIPGLLAAGLRLHRHATPGDGADDHAAVGGQGAGFRPRHEVAIQQHQLRDRGGDRRARGGDAVRWISCANGSSRR